MMHHTRILTADLHLHTTISDGHASPEALVAYVVEQTSLDVIAITDHDQIHGALRAVVAAQGSRVEVIVGEEISSRDGHILAYFIRERIPPGLSTAATIDAIHAQGGIAVAAHPYDWMVRSCGRNGLLKRAAGSDPEWRFDAIESLNASLRPRAANTQAAAAALMLGLPVIGGSDSHCLSTIGYGVTRFAGSSASDVRQALLQHATTVSGTYWSWGDMVEAGGRLLLKTIMG